MGLSFAESITRWGESTLLGGFARVASARDPNAVGSRIAGRYRVEELLGRGGMGAVYAVVDEASGRPVALKRLHTSRSPERERLLFRREFHTLATLRHPRIVEAFDFGIDEEGPFYTMELLDGRDFRDLSPVPYPRACALLRDVASALAFLHARRLLHRDVAPRNVRCTNDGQAKLFDFGVLATVGVPGELAGTPPCMPPEAFRVGPLDHRADLYGLGALSYWMLTGRHAYPVQNARELPEAWRRPPPPPSALVPGIPEALDDLVLSLLHAEPLARPADAAEVIERLGAIGGVARVPELETARGYLASATLVGRAAEMAELRAALDSATLGSGRAFLVEGPSGMGKSRLLRELSLEAQLAGATVLGAEGGANRGPWGVLRQLVVELLAACPELALRRARSHAPTVARAIPELVSRLGSVDLAPLAGDPREERARVQSGLIAWFVDIARTRPLAIVVDDMQRSDEASASVLAALAHEAKNCRLLLVIAVRTDEPVRAGAALSSLGDAGARLRLRGLLPEDVEALARGLFGDVPNLGRLSAWMHKVAGGSPLQCTELGRHLVECDVVRYVEGIWVIPDEFGQKDVPQSLAEAMDARVARLGDTARSLGQVLAVHGASVDLELAMALAETADEEEAFRALDELVAEEVLIGASGVYRFRHDGLREALSRSIPEERCRALHRRIGEALFGEGERNADREAEIGWHLLRGGDEDRGADLLARAGRRLYEAQSFQDAVAPLEAALDVYERRGDRARDCLDLRYMLVCSGFLCNRELTLKYADETLGVLRTLSGVETADRLGAVAGKPLAFAVGFSLATARWLLTLPLARRPNPVEAFRMYAVASMFTASVALCSFDLERLSELIRQMEPLDVFRGVPVLHVAYLQATSLRDLWLANFDRARESSLEVLRDLASDRLLPAETRKISEGGAHFVLAMTDLLDCASPRALESIEALERLGTKIWQIGAAQLRMIYHALRGEEEQARESRLEAEVLLLGVGAAWQMEVWVPPFLAFAYSHSRDLIGMKRTLEQIERLEQAGFAFTRTLEWLRSEYHRERDELDLALAANDRALATGAERDVIWHAIMAARADILLARGDHRRAREVALECLRASTEPGKRRLNCAVRSVRTIAVADALDGRADSALGRIERAIRDALPAENPVLLGLLHETAARVSLAASDAALHRWHLGEAERWYRPTRNPALIARYERLLDSGESAHLRSTRPPPNLPSDATATEPEPHPAFAADTLRGEGPPTGADESPAALDLQPDTGVSRSPKYGRG
jgi:tetratricopeptide (TPR) repeat protein